MPLRPIQVMSTAGDKTKPPAVTNRLTPAGWSFEDETGEVLLGEGSRGTLPRKPVEETRALQRLERVVTPWGREDADARRLEVYVGDRPIQRERVGKKDENDVLNDWFNRRMPRGLSVWYREDGLDAVPADVWTRYSAESLYARKIRQTVPVHVVSNVVLLGDTQQQVLLGTRTRRGRWLGYLETPGGKQEPGEDAYAASAREFHEEMGARLRWQDLQYRFILPLPEQGEMVSFEAFVYVLPRDAWWTPDLSKVSDRSHCATTWLSMANVEAQDKAGRLTPGTARALKHILDNRLFED
jgi:8-oxo-dGTP pyrophosphatase MutT (NUDIX family)